MNCFKYVVPRLMEDEAIMCHLDHVNILNGHRKTIFKDGETVLTTHRLFWGPDIIFGVSRDVLCLDLKYVESITEESNFWFFGKKSLILHLKQEQVQRSPTPLAARSIKITSRSGLNSYFRVAMLKSVTALVWDNSILDSKSQKPLLSSSLGEPSSFLIQSHLIDVEKKVQVKKRKMSPEITLALQDMKILMVMAKDLVKASTDLANPINENSEIDGVTGQVASCSLAGCVAAQSKALCLELGIEDPVCKYHLTNHETHFRDLAQQISSILLKPLKEKGIMGLCECFCLVNKARETDLLSPEDFMIACNKMNGLIRYYPSTYGGAFLQWDSYDEHGTALKTLEFVEAAQSLSAAELAEAENVSRLVAREKLFAAENLGMICRDKTVRGVRFYPNRMLKKWQRQEEQQT